MQSLEQTGRYYDRVEFQKAPPVYSRKDLYDAMFRFGEFNQERFYKILDAMCGSGLVGSELSSRLAQNEVPHRVYFSDLARKKLAELRKAGNSALAADVFEMPFPDGTFDRIYTRFGVKNYPKEQQKLILHEFRRLLAQGDLLVMTEMIAPDEAYDFSQQERREKHKYTGLEGNEPHIPTSDVLYSMLYKSGFMMEKEFRTVSKVTTKDWVSSKQMTEEDLQKFNAFLLSAPEDARTALNIREEDGLVKVDYPMMVMSAKAV